MCVGRPQPHSLEHVAVELLLAVAQELSDHLAAQALTLEQEMGHSDGGVGDEASRDQELDALVRVSGGGVGRGGGVESEASLPMTPFLPFFLPREPTEVPGGPWAEFPGNVSIPSTAEGLPLKSPSRHVLLNLPAQE